MEKFRANGINKVMKLTVIVPIYNAEKYLCRCLDSLLLIPCPEMEILCINDGSTDFSWEICEKYMSQDCRVKAFSQENAGPMAARNCGLRKAAGEYICFVDSDDWIDPEMPLCFIRKMDEEPSIDICVSDVVRNYSDGSVQEMFRQVPERIYTGEEAWKEMILNRTFFWYMCGKIYRRSAIEGLHTDESVLTGEDLEFNWELFRNGRIRKVWYSPEYRYHYFANPESLTEGVEILKRRKSDWKVYMRILSGQEGGLKKELSDPVKKYALHALYDILRELCFYNADDSEFEKYVKEGKKLAISLEENYSEDFGYVSRMRELTESTKQVREFFSEVFEAMRMTVISMLPVEKDKAVYIYGAGIAARYTAEILKNFLNYDGHVVSDDRPCAGRFFGKPVFHLFQIPKDSVLLLALNQSNQKAVLPALAGYRHVIRLPVPDSF